MTALFLSLASRRYSHAGICQNGNLTVDKTYLRFITTGKLRCYYKMSKFRFIGRAPYFSVPAAAATAFTTSGV